ncbi:zinc finger protein 425-like [Varroa jacobsoni]|uniref:zinc finger protein 425-like n=1 Tax=Varroa jacobsoni TaxID=62625 RepID=UPI000BFA5D79|nr:zinc finger protein 425-like [Varroa jacobsoni]XP_022707592.1 zinc finger protein 425-like [Varroa jacobsoni]XP_022707593.1 zinc finger protein 425-like [Varroa jacobsoni]
MNDASVDTHLCIRCNETIVGIGAYLDHRREDCLGSTGSIASTSVVTLANTANTASGLPSSIVPVRDVLDIPFLPDAPELPDFFLSLDLQRITPLVEPVDVDEAAENEDNEDNDEDEDDTDPLRPPRGHTGGKWRPGSRPSIMNGLSFHRVTLQDHSPERLPDILEKMGCAPCGRIFRDKYTYQRHLESALHRKRSLRNAKMIQEQYEPSMEIQPPELIIGNLLKRTRSSRMHKEVANPLLGESQQTKETIKKAQYRCSLCFRWFHNFRRLHLHMAEHRQLDGFCCSHCPQKFSEERELRLHLKTHKEHHTCCGTIFSTTKGYREHKERVHVAIREWLSCSSCKRKYQTGRALREHVCGNSEEKIPCSDCNYRGSRKNLALHKRTHFDDKRYKCPKCKLVFTRHGQLWRHLKLHKGDKTYQCPYCDYSCVLIENLRAHILKGSKHKGLYVYPCKKCSFGTNSAIEAKYHADLHQVC